MATNFVQGKGHGPILEIKDLDIYYGKAHALQGVSLSLGKGVLGVVGKNGMGKTSLCNAITGLVPAKGSIKLAGEEILGLSPHRITAKGIGYVPQGRRMWPSLTVDEHLRLASRTAGKGDWTVERVYRLFPRLAERKNNGGSQLSGGEQQMVAIGRALLFNPRLLVMDEPTEGLAPVIVDLVVDTLKSLAHQEGIAILLIEQNLGVAIDVADTVAVMVNGRIARTLAAAELAADHDLQQLLLGVKQSGGQDEEPAAAPVPEDDVLASRIFTVQRAGDIEMPGAPSTAGSETDRTMRKFNRWSQGSPSASVTDVTLRREAAGASLSPAPVPAPPAGADNAKVFEFSVAHSAMRAAYIAGTFDTKARELFYLRTCIERLGLRAITVDLSTSGKPSPANIHPREVARHHPQGERAVFTGDRGSSVTAMAEAFENFIATRRDLGGLISAGGSGGTAMATRAMRRLPIGVPKVMVSTVASGDVKPYVGPADICMMYSVTDVSGLNRISERVLANAAHALSGMLAYAREASADVKPALGLTMFGLTTPCVQAVSKALEQEYDCLVFHATGTGGMSLEKLAESGLLAGVIDVSTTEIADELVGGVMSAGPQRMDAIIHARLPYVGSCGALDMVNFWARDTVPSKFKARNLYQHNDNVTLMRTNPEENRAIGEFIAAKLNRMDGPVRFLIPEGGLSMLDMPGKPFWDPVADKALFQAIESNFRQGGNRKLIRLPYNINDPLFAAALVASFNEIGASTRQARLAGR
ncbi:MAG: hypothetical protein JWQ23_292 [Herminiimonas sp.]|nr:hypothetical protein [Herminiimonas sp.]